MNAAKVTLTSTILAAAFGLALGLSAVPSDSYACHKGNVEHGNQTDCDNGGGGGGIVYTAQLTDGAFVFAPVNPVPVTPNQREDVLRSEVDLNLDINDSPEPDTWVDMFAICAELWEPGPRVHGRRQVVPPGAWGHERLRPGPFCDHREITGGGIRRNQVLSDLGRRSTLLH